MPRLRERYTTPLAGDVVRLKPLVRYLLDPPHATVRHWGQSTVELVHEQSPGSVRLTAPLAGVDDWHVRDLLLVRRAR